METLPTYDTKALQPVRKTHRLRNTLLTIVGIVVVLALAVAWMGVYNIPVLSSLLGANKPVDLGVHPTEADLASAERDNPMTLTGTPGEFQLTRNKTYSGTVPVNDTHSSAEMTAFIRKYHGSAGHVRDIQVKFRDGGMELSGFITSYVKAPAYVDVDVVYTAAGGINVDLKKAKLGRLSVPEKYFDDIEEAAERIMRREMANVPGFSVESLTYTAGMAAFVGTLPQTVTLTEGSRSIQSFLN